MKVGFFTLGCKVNKYESDAIAQALRQCGYEIAQEPMQSDIVVVNSCTVTSTADSKTEQAVRRFKRQGKTVILTGCMPQAYPDRAKKLTQADIVTGNAGNDSIPQLLGQFLQTGERIIAIRQHVKGEPFSVSCICGSEGRTRAVIKIQDGCDRFCAYCIIPYARGRVRSKPLAALREELRLLASAGYREVVYAGINLSSYGRDISLDLYDAVKAAEDTPGIERIRLGSLEPDHMTDEMIRKLSTCRKLCGQFHISLQSGCDKTLKAMNRHYDSAGYRRICESLRAHFPGCSLTTDYMVGFPGESEEDFAAGLAFVRQIGFEKVHVFPYSPREGTRAAKADGQLPEKLKHERCKKAIEVCDRLHRQFLDDYTGKCVNVLLESKAADGSLTGYTEAYLPVKIKAPQADCGEIIRCIITGNDGQRCNGEPV